MRALLTATFLVLLLAGCGGSETEEAESYVRQACTAQPPEPGGAANGLPSGIHDRAQAQKARYSNSAAQAARAARLDPRWDALNKAYSTIVDTWSFVQSIPDDPSEVTDDQRRWAADHLAEVNAAAATIRAECRKVATG